MRTLFRRAGRGKPPGGVKSPDASLLVGSLSGAVDPLSEGQGDRVARPSR